MSTTKKQCLVIGPYGSERTDTRAWSNWVLEIRAACGEGLRI